MFSIDTLVQHERMSTQDLLLAIGEAVARGETEFDIHASGQHDIGGPLWNAEGRTLRFHVTNPGQRVGCMGLDHTEIVVEGSAPADVGWLNSGARITVKGDAGDTAGHCAASGVIYIGGRALLINHRISVPPREEESQYASGNQQVIYIGVDEAVCAMLVLTYAADRRRKNELQRLEDSGISVIVRTTDPNVTTQLVSRLFGIDTASVGILDSRLGEEYQKLAQKEIPRADALVATKGRMESMMNVISACVEERRTVSMVVAIQNAAMVLGFVLVAFLACFGAMGQLTSLVLFLFQLFWVLVTLVLPKLRR